MLQIPPAGWAVLGRKQCLWNPPSPACDEDLESENPGIPSCPQSAHSMPRESEAAILFQKQALVLSGGSSEDALVDSWAQGISQLQG